MKWLRAKFHHWRWIWRTRRPLRIQFDEGTTIADYGDGEPRRAVFSTSGPRRLGQRVIIEHHGGRLFDGVVAEMQGARTTALDAFAFFRGRLR